jgi:hypothetical protein
MKILAMQWFLELLEELGIVAPNASGWTLQSAPVHPRVPPDGRT